MCGLWLLCFVSQRWLLLVQRTFRFSGWTPRRSRLHRLIGDPTSPPAPPTSQIQLLPLHVPLEPHSIVIGENARWFGCLVPYPIANGHRLEEVIRINYSLAFSRKKLLLAYASVVQIINPRSVVFPSTEFKFKSLVFLMFLASFYFHVSEAQKRQGQKNKQCI